MKDVTELTVPEDCIGVSITIYGDAGSVVHSVVFANDNKTYEVPLKYLILPDLIANRLQGLRTNQNFSQRLVFIYDGMKLFKQSPIFGIGIGSYESNIRSVQSYFYETKYVHNHYIQSLIDTGIIGFLAFISIFVVPIVWIKKEKRKRNPVFLDTMLTAFIAYIAGIALLEIVFSSTLFLLVCFPVFLLFEPNNTDSSEETKQLKAVRLVSMIIFVVWLFTFFWMLFLNVRARNLYENAKDATDIERAIRSDFYDRADYMLFYAYATVGDDIPDWAKQKGEKYAEELGKMKSNTAQYMIAEYYFQTGKWNKGFEMLEKYVDFMKSDSKAWQRAFDVLKKYDTDETHQMIQQEIDVLGDKLETYNQTALEPIVLAA